MTPRPGIAARLYCAALRSYPADFRARYHDELVATFEAGLRDAGGGPGAARFVLSALVGALRNGLMERVARARPLRGWGRDVRLSVRGLAARPGFALTVVAVTAIAVAVATVVFAVVDGTLLRRPSHGDPERTVIVWGRNAQNGQLRDVVSGSNYVDLRRGAAAFEHMAAIKPDDIAVVDDGRPRVVPTLTVTWEFFEVLGVEAARGRTFTRADGLSGSEPVVVLTDGARRRLFRGEDEVVGRRIRTNTGRRTIVGILPQTFEFAAQAELFVPLHDDVLATHDRTSYDYWIVGLLRRGETIDRANEQLESVMQRIRAEDPRLSGWTVSVESLQATVTEAVRPVLVALALAIGMLLVVAVANVGGLFLIHANALRSQVAIEAALGAGRWPIIRRLASEAFVATAAGGALGVAGAVAGLRLMPAWVPPFVAIPGSAAQVTSLRASFDLRVALFAVAIILAVATIGGLASIAAATAHNPAGALGAADRSRTAARPVRWAHDAFVVAQVAFATLLLFAGLLGLGTFRHLVAADTGLRPGGVLTLYVGDLDEADNTGRALYFRRLLDGVAQVAGVSAVGLNDYVPLQAEDDFEGITFLDRPPPAPGQGVREEWRRVSEAYFDAAGIEVVAGRGFRRADFGAVDTVAVVNEAFVRRHYPDGNVLGARLLIHEEDYGEAVIVGVVRDVLRRGVREAAPPVLYVPFDKHPRPNMALFVRTEGAPEPLAEAVQEAIWSVDPDQPIDRVAALDRVVARSVGVARLAMVVLGLLSVTALVLASLGIFAVLAYVVRTRAAELGIRMALGATGASLQRAVVSRGLLLCASGALLGAVLATWALRAADSLLFGVRPGEPGVVALVIALLLAVAVVASWLPARRIANIAPSDALRRT